MSASQLASENFKLNMQTFKTTCAKRHIKVYRHIVMLPSNSMYFRPVV